MSKWKIAALFAALVVGIAQALQSRFYDWIINQIMQHVRDPLIQRILLEAARTPFGLSAVVVVLFACLAGLIVLVVRTMKSAQSSPVVIQVRPAPPAPIHLPKLDAPHEKLLATLWAIQRRLGTRKIFITQYGSSTPTYVNITIDMLGVTVEEFQRLMETMPREYVEFYAYADARADQVYVLSVTDAGRAYLESVPPVSLPDPPV